MNITIFSKDRACQLNALLESYYRFTEGTIPVPTVLYTYSSPEFAAGYELLVHRFPKVNFVQETNFKSDLNKSINPKDPFTVFFVDDIVFRNYFDFNGPIISYLESRADVICLSLRLSPSIERCHTQNYNTPPPIFEETEYGLIWNWRFAHGGDWAYPMSVDGHIFRTTEILLYLQLCNYKKPNTLEVALSDRPLNRPKMMCLPDHIVFNVPNNTVQTECHNREMGGSAIVLNQRYLAGERIDIDHLATVKNNSPHFEVNYHWV